MSRRQQDFSSRGAQHLGTLTQTSPSSSNQAILRRIRAMFVYVNNMSGRVVPSSSELIS